MLPIPLITGVPQDPALLEQLINQYVLTAINSSAPGLLSSALTSTGNTADTNEDTLQTFSLAPGLLNVNGKGLRIKAWGSTANNADTKALRIYHGTTVLNFALNTASAAVWTAEFVILRTGAATQVASGTVLHGAALIAPLSASGTDTLANQLTAKITGQASAANANDIVCTAAYVELLQ